MLQLVGVEKTSLKHLHLLATWCAIAFCESTIIYIYMHILLLLNIIVFTRPRFTAYSILFPLNSTPPLSLSSLTLFKAWLLFSLVKVFPELLFHQMLLNLNLSWNV